MTTVTTRFESGLPVVVVDDYFAPPGYWTFSIQEARDGSGFALLDDYDELMAVAPTLAELIGEGDGDVFARYIEQRSESMASL